MRVLVLDQFSELGGAQRNLLLLLEAFRARRWDALVGLPGEGELSQRVRNLGFETFAIRCGPFSLGAKSILDMARFACQLPLQAWRIRNRGTTFRPANEFPPGAYARRAAEMMLAGELLSTRRAYGEGAALTISDWTAKLPVLWKAK